LVSHEIAHAAIWDVAPFEGVKVDSRGGMSEAGAMHEGFSDYFAAAINGASKLYDYVGPRIGTNTGFFPSEGASRDLENTLTCPEVIEGEPHRDSRHFSAALWSLRKNHLGTDQGKTFDGAVYAAIASLSKSSGFNGAVTSLASAAATAFGSPTIGTDVTQTFTSRGVIGCPKVLVYTGPRALYGIEGLYPRCCAPSPYVPGPIQFRLTLPSDSSDISFQAPYQSRFAYLANAPSGRILAKIGGPITFTGFAAITDDATLQAPASFAGGAMTASLDLTGFGAAGTDVYFTFVSTSPYWLGLINFTAIPTPAPPDAGTVTRPPDAGTKNAEQDAGTASQPPPKGCGCGVSGIPAVAAVLISLALASRRRRRGVQR
jgi:hypothetical protein